MTSQRVERTWIRTGDYGRFRGEWVKNFWIIYFKYLNGVPVNYLDILQLGTLTTINKPLTFICKLIAFYRYATATFVSRASVVIVNFVLFSQIMEQNDLQCSCCFELMVEPTTLNCGHSFCRFCLAKWWDTSKRATCPDCRQPWVGFPKVNIVLR